MQKIEYINYIDIALITVYFLALVHMADAGHFETLARNAGTWGDETCKDCQTNQSYIRLADCRVSELGIADDIDALAKIIFPVFPCPDHTNIVNRC